MKGDANVKKTALFLCVLLIILLFSVTAMAADGTDILLVQGDYFYDSAFEVLRITNAERAKAGVGALTMDKDLLDAAMLRAMETTILFDHKRPNGESCFSVCGKMMGENIAAGQLDAAAVMVAWVNSPPHLKNLLNDKYTIAGMGCVNVGGKMYWVQLFGDQAAVAVSQPTNKNAEQEIEVQDSEVAVDLKLNDRGAAPVSQPLGVGAKLQLATYVINGGWDYLRAPILAKSFFWESSNSAVATVNQEGLLETKSGGKVLITATTERGNVCSLIVSVAGGRIALGDVNLDGSVNAPDILALRNYILSITPLLDEQLPEADANTDDVVTVADIMAIRKMILS